MSKIMFRKKPPIPTEPPTWIIVGLGNPGPEYKGTRHNVGFDLVERIGEANRIKLEKGRSRCVLGVGRIGDTTVALVKPLTFMNLSGQAIGPLARQMGIPPEHILVLADDLDLEVGTIRLRLDGSAGGHNGHKSIIQTLGSSVYPRLKIGIGSNKDDTIDHVLSKFKPIERDEIDDAIVAGRAICEQVVAGNWNEALELVTRHNRNNLPEE